MIGSWGQFHQHFPSSFYACRSQRCKKHWWLDCLFALLGSVGIKAAHKHVGEIDPWFTQLLEGLLIFCIWCTCLIYLWFFAQKNILVFFWTQKNKFSINFSVVLLYFYKSPSLGLFLFVQFLGCLFGLFNYFICFIVVFELSSTHVSFRLL